MKEVDEAFGYYAIFGGDVTQDEPVHSGDYPDVVNDNFNYRTRISGNGYKRRQLGRFRRLSDSGQ